MPFRYNFSLFVLNNNKNTFKVTHFILLSLLHIICKTVSGKKLSEVFPNSEQMYKLSFCRFVRFHVTVEHFKVSVK